MHEIAKISLETEMDLILAHKHTMKLAELAGLSIAAQTTFATAVSEAMRNVIGRGQEASLRLGVDLMREKEWNLVAQINEGLVGGNNAGLQYAKKLVDNLNVNTTPSDTQISLYVKLHTNKLTLSQIQQWKTQFSNNPPLSPYEEIKRKNHQLRDLTDRLRDSENRYKILTDSLPLVIFTISPQGELLFANEWLTTLTGKTIDQVNQTRGQNIIADEDIQGVCQQWESCIERDIPFQHEFRIKNNTGELRWHIAYASSIDKSKKSAYWTGFLVDIHAQKIVDQTLLANEELRQAQEQLKNYQTELVRNIQELNRSNQELAQFAYVASHDLQEPLRKIQSFATMLTGQYTSELSPPALDLFQRMQSAASRMHELIRDLLTYSRLNTRHEPFQLVPLQTVFTQVLDDLETSIRERNAQITTEELPTILGNKLQLHQLLQNLISNAIKFTPQGRSPVIHIKSSLVKQTDHEELPHRYETYAAISVEDNGIGFDEKYSDRIFQLFQRLHGKNQYAGTGIGLAICKKVVDLHGGMIEANSIPGTGATFTVYLPNVTH